MIAQKAIEERRKRDKDLQGAQSVNYRFKH